MNDGQILLLHFAWKENFNQLRRKFFDALLIQLRTQNGAKFVRIFGFAVKNFQFFHIQFLFNS